MIGKWLNAGVMEDGSISFPDAGSPQGGVISPLLANVYLHYVLDEWLEHEVKPRLQGRAYLVRYADDFVLGFTHERDAQRVMEVLPKRFGRYGLTIHPEKTRLISFQCPSRLATGKGGESGQRPGRFEFLGFTHYWARSRKGNWVVRRKTASSRMDRAIRKITQWCRSNRHQPIQQQQRKLSAKMRGHYAYYGITGNAPALSQFHHAVQRGWRRWLSRRHRRKNPMQWKRFKRLLERYPLPPVRVVHSVYAHVANP